MSFAIFFWFEFLLFYFILFERKFQGCIIIFFHLDLTLKNLKKLKYLDKKLFFLRYEILLMFFLKISIIYFNDIFFYILRAIICYVYIIRYFILLCICVTVKSLKKEFLFKNVFFENKQWNNMEIGLLSTMLFNQKICQSMNE